MSTIYTIFLFCWGEERWRRVEESVLVKPQGRKVGRVSSKCIAVTTLNFEPLPRKRHVNPIMRVIELQSRGRRLIYSLNPNRTVPNKSSHLSVRHCLTMPTRPGDWATNYSGTCPYLGDYCPHDRFAMLLSCGLISRLQTSQHIIFLLNNQFEDDQF